MKTMKELQEFRAGKVAGMKAIQDKGDAIVATDLSTIKTMSDEIKQIDMQMEAIETTRISAMKDSAPETVKKATAKDDFKDAFVAYLKGDIGERQLSKFQAAVGAGDVGAGLETVPTDFLKELQEAILEYGVIAPDARNITTANNGTLHIPMIDDTSNAGVWTAEHGATTPEDFATSEIKMDSFKVTTAIVVSTELLEDSAFNIPSYLAGALGTRLSRTMEDSYINGDGSSKPEGILTSSYTKSIASIAETVIESADALALIGAIQPTSRNGAVFYASDSAIMAMTGWVDGNLRPLLQVSSSATNADWIQYSLYGYPVKPNYNLGDLVVGDSPLIFGNPMSYMIRNVRNINVRRSDDVRILNDEVVFVATARVDAKIVNANDSFAKLVMTTP